MNTFCQQFGQRSLSSSAVRTRLNESSNGKRLQIRFLLSEEVVEIAGWKVGEYLDISSDGSRLVIEPSPLGRKLHDKPLFVEFSSPKRELKEVVAFLGFDIQKNHFWEQYTVEGRKLVLLLKDIDVPILP